MRHPDQAEHEYRREVLEEPAQGAENRAERAEYAATAPVAARGVPDLAAQLAADLLAHPVTDLTLQVALLSLHVDHFALDRPAVAVERRVGQADVALHTASVAQVERSVDDHHVPAHLAVDAGITLHHHQRAVDRLARRHLDVLADVELYVGTGVLQRFLERREPPGLPQERPHQRGVSLAAHRHLDGRRRWCLGGLLGGERVLERGVDPRRELEPVSAQVRRWRPVPQRLRQGAVVQTDGFPQERAPGGVEIVSGLIGPDDLSVDEYRAVVKRDVERIAGRELQAELGLRPADGNLLRHDGPFLRLP